MLVAIMLIPLVFCREIGAPRDIENVNHITTKDDLSRLLGNVDFTSLEIVDIRVIEGTVYVFCEGPDDAIQFYIEDGFHSPYFAENVLGRVYLGEDDVLAFATAEGLYRDRQRDSIRQIFWLQLDRNYSSTGNILLVTDLPHWRVRVDTRAIMNER